MKFICAAFLIIAIPDYSMELNQKLIERTPESEQKTQNNSRPFALLALGQPRTSWISPTELCLEKDSAARAMSWLPALYNSSGLASCMSKECFMVNALAKIKDAIANEENRLLALRVCADLARVPLVADEQSPRRTLLPANCAVSGLALFGTFLYKYINTDPIISVKYPRQVYIPPVQTSCERIYMYLGQTWGTDWAHECIMKSWEINAPCNTSAIGRPDTSFCCWAKVDPLCNEVIVDYMNNTYPALYSAAENLYSNLKDQAIRATSMPFYITASTVVTLNLLFQLAGYKYRKMMHARITQTEEIKSQQITQGNA